MIFIDSNILAYAFYDNDRKDKCQQAIQKGGIINTVNLIEAYNIIQFEVSREHATKSIKSLLKSNLIIVDVNTNLVFEALKRTLKNTNLKFVDMVHYSCAIVNNCNSIMSYDKDFDNLDIPRKEP